MAKLYSDVREPEIELGQVVNQWSDLPTEADIGDPTDGLYDIEFATEHFSEITNKLQTTHLIRRQLSSRKLASMEYFVTLESYTPILETIAGNMGVKVHVASLEDFNNECSSQAAHTVAMEGISDFIKNLWKKLKEVMNQFFRKVREFVRRLVNANMEIDSYEKYVPAMISKIKSEKLKLLDNSSTISSKLPALLAYEGMDKIDSDFILSSGLRSLDTLTEVINNQVRVGLKQVSSIDLVRVRKVIEGIVDVDYNDPNSATVLNKLKEDLNNAILSIVKTLLPVPYQANDIPEDAYESLSNSAVMGKLSDMAVWGLSDNLDPHYSLPKGFNAFVAIDPLNKVYSTSTSTYNSNIDDRINPLSSIESISRVYEFYKKFTKQINVRELDAIIGNTEKEIDATIKIMAGKYLVLLEKLDKLEIGGVSLINKIEGYISFLNQEISTPKSSNPEFARFNPDLFDFLSKDEYSRAVDLVANHKNPEEILKGLDRIYESLGLADAFKKHMESILPSFDPEAKKDIIKALDENQKFILSFFQALQVLLRGLSGSLIATYTECRYELIRYVYQSAKRYG